MKSCLHYTERQFVEKEIKRNESIIVFETREREKQRGEWVLLFLSIIFSVVRVFAEHIRWRVNAASLRNSGEKEKKKKTDGNQY